MTTIRGTTPAWVAALTDAALADACGEGTFARATGYVADGHVRLVSSADRGAAILAEVDGSGTSSYSVFITAHGDLEGDPHGGESGDVEWTSRCSCPVRVDCKHVVATLLVLRDRGDGAGAAVVPSWRERLAPWLQPEPARTDETPLGIQLVLAAGPPGPWGQQTRRVEIRPLRRSRVGRWVSISTWRQAQVGMGHEAVPDTHLAQAAAMVRLLTKHSGGWSSGTADLDTLGADGWKWLQHAIGQGMEVHTGGTIGRAGLHDQAIAVDHTELVPTATVRAADDGGLTTTVAWDGIDPTQRVTLLGSPPHSALVEPRRGRAQITVRPLASVDGPITDLVGAGTLVVPPEDVPEFVTDYLPGLRRRLSVQSPDGAVEATATRRPVLVVTVRGAADGGVGLTFGLRYAVGSHSGPALPIEAPIPSLHRRDARAEAALLRGIPALAEVPGCRLGSHGGELHRIPPESTRLVGLAALRFVTETVPALRAHDDVEVEIADDVPTYEEAAQDAEVTLDVDEPLDGSTDWFDLTLTVAVEGERVGLAELLTAMRRGEDLLVLPSGTWFRLDQAALEPLRLLLAESQLLGDASTGEGRIRLGRFDLGWWDELVQSGVVGRQCEAWQRHSAVLSALALDGETPVPEGLQATLRPYQLDGYRWLAALWDAGLGGVLADDMGLGKTLQTLALLQRAKERGDLGDPVLVVVPTSVLATWVDEAARFTPGLDVRTVPRTTAARKSPLADLVEGADVVVTTYAVARIDAAAFAERRWRGLVLDEAQQVKNFRSKTYQAVRQLDRGFTLTVTGTPIENDLMDLWSQLSLAAAGLFPSPDVFQRQWSRPIAGGDRVLAEQLRRRIRPLMLRRTKEEVAPDLPPKQITDVRLDMTPGHRRIYDRALLRERQRMLGLLDDPDANRVEILAALTRMRQLALDPALVPHLASAGGQEVDPDTLPSSAKVDHLIDQVIELAAEGHRALVFSQFTTFLQRVRRRLDAAGLSSAYLDGGTRDRQSVIREFKDGAAPVFLISLKAGGVGLTLTEADYVFVLDPWWNPAAEAQAIDRAHRIGQDKAVMVYRLVSADSIEDKVLALQDRKRALADRLVGDDSFAGSLTREDILGLFEAPA